MTSALYPSRLPRPSPGGRLPASVDLAERATPWNPSAVTRWGVTVIAGGLAVGLAWYMASGDKTYPPQVAQIDLAAFGLIAASAANLWMLLVARREVGWRRRSLLGEAAPRRAGYRATAESGTLPSTVAASIGSAALVAGADLKQYHTPDCPMARGKSWSSASREMHESLGRVACRVCRS